MRGGSSARGRGGNTGPYVAARGGQNGGRGGRGGAAGQRGGLNAGAQTFSPPGQAGNKRPREDGPAGQQPGNGNGKRPRGG